MRDEFDVVVVGSGAGGGVVAGELAQRGRDVLLLECGPHRTAADFTRLAEHLDADPKGYLRAKAAAMSAPA